MLLRLGTRECSSRVRSLGYRTVGRQKNAGEALQNPSTSAAPTATPPPARYLSEPTPVAIFPPSPFLGEPRRPRIAREIPTRPLHGNRHAPLEHPELSTIIAMDNTPTLRAARPQENTAFPNLRLESRAIRHTYAYDGAWRYRYACMRCLRHRNARSDMHAQCHASVVAHIVHMLSVEAKQFNIRIRKPRYVPVSTG